VPPVAGEQLRIAGAEAELPGVLKLSWSDGYEGIVDPRGLIAEGELVGPLRNPDTFRNVHVATSGIRSIGETTATRMSISDATDCARSPERQAALLAHGS
jgi:hypothetical protein